MRLRKKKNSKTSRKGRASHKAKIRAGKQPEISSRPVTRERTDVLLRLIYLLAIFSIAFFGINAHWPCLKHIDVRGTGIYSSDEIISLAGLGDSSGLWACALPLDTIANSLEKNPFIEEAKISLTGLNSIRVQITERRPVAAINYNGFRFVFDRTGELLEILRPDAVSHVPEVTNVPLGLLKYNGEPLFTKHPAWRLPENSSSPEIMERQFDRLIQLRYFLDRYTPDREEFLTELSMDNEGRLTVKYLDCPPILLGKFDSPEIQIRRLVAALDDSYVTNTERTSLIDLSSVMFPCYHVNENYLTNAELRFIERTNTDQADAQLDLVPVTVFDDPSVTGEVSDSTDAESVDGEAWVEADDDEDNAPIIGDRIFSLGDGG
ncbi:MAG: FtsQ-type POTRA domain-containing protein [bacterium]|nr:FtsQ-type POTRA domain-containing protein [bacterium]